MSGWMKSLVGYFLMTSIVMQMLPHKKYEKYIRLFTGLLLIMLLLQPILKIGSADTFLENQILQFLEEQEQLETSFLQKQELVQSGAQEQIFVVEIENVEVEVRKNDKKAQ